MQSISKRTTSRDKEAIKKNYFPSSLWYCTPVVPWPPLYELPFVIKLLSFTALSSPSPFIGLGLRADITPSDISFVFLLLIFLCAAFFLSIYEVKKTYHWSAESHLRTSTRIGKAAWRTPRLPLVRNPHSQFLQWMKYIAWGACRHAYIVKRWTQKHFSLLLHLNEKAAPSFTPFKWWLVVSALMLPAAHALDGSDRWLEWRWWKTQKGRIWKGSRKTSH